MVPLGTTIHMCGGAVSFSLLGLFCSSLFGVEITFGKYVLMLIYAILINMAAPGIPNGGVAIGATYLQLLGIPLDFIGFYSGIYKLLDMIYTSLNVTDVNLELNPNALSPIFLTFPGITTLSTEVESKLPGAISVNPVPIVIDFNPDE